MIGMMSWFLDFMIRDDVEDVQTLSVLAGMLGVALAFLMIPELMPIYPFIMVAPMVLVIINNAMFIVGIWNRPYLSFVYSTMFVITNAIISALVMNKLMLINGISDNYVKIAVLSGLLSLMTVNTMLFMVSWILKEENDRPLWRKKA